MLPSLVRQGWAVFGALLNIAACGFHLGYPAVLLNALRAPDSPIPLKLETESWITSSIAFTTMISFIFIAPVMERYGRKMAHIVVIIPAGVACVLLYYASDVTALVVARLVSGLTTGGTVTLAAIIIGEFTSPDSRGFFLNTKTASVCFGIGLVHVLGAFFDWRTVAILGLALSVPSLLVTLTWPESPAWLARRGYFQESEKCFYWLRGHSPRAQEELHALLQAQKKRRFSKLSECGRTTLAAKLKKFFARFARKDFQRPTMIVACVFIILETCGRHVIPAYAVKFMTAFTGDSGHAFYYIVGLDTVVFLTSVASCVIVNMFRRRTLLFITGTICNILLLIICLYLFLKSKDIVPKDNVWLPLTLLVLYFIVLNIGTSPIVLTLLGEVFPLEHRPMGIVVSGVFFSMSLLITLKVTPAMINAIDVYGTFLVFSACMIGALLYMYFYLPETKGKTLQEIEEDFSGKTPLADNAEKKEMIGDENV